MKIRTDFVTNSSSSSFVLEICIDLENGKSLLFEANGGTAESGIIDYFWSDATVTVSPKQLGNAKSVQELIELLKNGVYDGWVSEGDKLFENVSTGGYKRKHNPTHFIAMIQEYVHSIEDISRIVITGNESGGLYTFSDPHYHRTFAYSPKTGDYVCTIDGCEFEKDGSSGGDLLFTDEAEAQEVERIGYGYGAITTKGYAIQKGKEAKQKLREAIASGSVEAVLGEAGTAGSLSTQYAREVSPAPERIAFKGKNFVHTSCSNETLIDKFVMSKGGEVRSSTVQATDYLIIGNDIDHKTTKIVRAQELNAKGKSITAMTECEFWTLAAECKDVSSQEDETGPAAPLRVAITGTYPGFTKKDFEKYVVGKGMVFKSQPSNQVDYFVVENEHTYNWAKDRFSAKPVYLPDFLAVIGIPMSDFEKEIAQVISQSQEEKEQKAAIAICETEILDVEHIQENAYANDLSLKTVRIGGRAKTIGKNAFANCANLTSLILSDGIVEIQDGAFKKCTALEKIEFPSSVRIIGEDAFFGCKKLTSVLFNEGLETLGRNAFRASPKLTEVCLPNSLKELDCRFQGCKIKKVVFPEGLEKLYLFESNLNLSYLKMPATTKMVEIDAAYGKHITEIDYAGTILDFFNIDFGVRGLSTKCIVRCSDGVIDFSGDHIILPAGVPYVRHLFRGRICKTIELPSTLRAIGDHGLFLYGITELSIPEGVEKLENFAIWCDTLKKLIIPSSLEYLDAYALSGCEALCEIYYDGTKSQWKNIDKGRGWDKDFPAYMIFCTDGTIKGKQ